MNDSHILIELNGKKFSIDAVSPAELSLLHGAIREILEQDFDWFSSEEKIVCLRKLDHAFGDEVIRDT